MLNIAILLIVGSLLAYISKDNAQQVTIVLGNISLADVPLFYVISASALFGVTVSYLVQIGQNIKTFLMLNKKAKMIDKDQGEILDLTKRIHELELVNQKLQQGGAEMSDPMAL